MELFDDYNIFRWYRAGWGRYTQADPVDVSQSDYNAYRYAMSNPITMFDREGLKAEIVCANIGVFGLKSTPLVHCRIRVTCDKCEGGKFGGPYDTSVGLERNRQSGKLNVTNDPIPSNYGRAYPIGGVDQNDSCQFGRCIQAHAAQMSPSAAGWQPKYSLFGPNSNTFAGCLVRKCGGQGPPSGPFGAVGFNQPCF